MFLNLFFAILVHDVLHFAVSNGCNSFLLRLLCFQLVLHPFLANFLLQLKLSTGCNFVWPTNVGAFLFVLVSLCCPISGYMSIGD